MTPMTKPQLHLIKKPTAEDIAKLYERLTGCKPTPQEMQEIEIELREGGEARLIVADRSTKKAVEIVSGN